MSETLTETLRIPVAPSVKERLERIAERDDRTLSWVVRSAVDKYLDADKQRRGK